MKQISLILLLVLFVILSFVISANAQTKDTDFTWGELKQVQTHDRTLLENRQQEELRNLLELQKAELNKALASDFTELTSKNKDERREMARIHSEERTKLAQIQADERRAFLQNRKP